MDRLDVKNRFSLVLEGRLREDWMDDYSYQRKLSFILNKSGETMDSIADKILIGIKNGYDLDFQIKIMNNISNWY